MKRTVALIVYFLVACGCFAQNHPHRMPDERGPRPERGRRQPPVELVELAAGFAPDSVVGNGRTVYYYTKSYNFVDSANRQPCIFVFLHGGGCQEGNDNGHLCRAELKTFDSCLKQRGVDAVVVAPRCPAPKWKDVAAQIYTMIDTVANRCNADSSRIYLVGSSFGAQGGWALLSDSVDIFAAAQLGSHLPREYDAQNVARTPIYFTMGEYDFSDPAKCEPIVKDLQERGAEVVFKVFSGMNHPQACKSAISPESIEFLLSHSKGKE